MESKSPLVYIKEQLQVHGKSFAAEWGALTDKDKADLKEWAEIEMKERGI